MGLWLLILFVFPFASACFTGELWQECDRAPAVCQKEQAKPSYLEQTARRNEEISKSEGEICTDSDHTDHYLIIFSSPRPEIALEKETVDICLFNHVFFTSGGNKKETQDDHNGVSPARKWTPLHCRCLSIRLTVAVRTSHTHYDLTVTYPPKPDRQTSFASIAPVSAGGCRSRSSRTNRQ